MSDYLGKACSSRGRAGLERGAPPIEIETTHPGRHPAVGGVGGIGIVRRRRPRRPRSSISSTAVRVVGPAARDWQDPRRRLHGSPWLRCRGEHGKRRPTSTSRGAGKGAVDERGEQRIHDAAARSASWIVSRRRSQSRGATGRGSEPAPFRHTRKDGEQDKRPRSAVADSLPRGHRRGRRRERLAAERADGLRRSAALKSGQKGSAPQINLWCQPAVGVPAATPPSNGVEKTTPSQQPTNFSANRRDELPAGHSLSPASPGARAW